jgi:hypothetical protein
MVHKTRCGHYEQGSFPDSHGGLCRKCHSNFVFLVDIEKKYGEDALVQYWYSLILANLPSSKEEIHCLVSHLMEFYQAKLIERPSKRKYIEKMLYMLQSLEDPFNIEELK